MKRTLSLFALALASATAVAAPVSYDFKGTLTSADWFSRDPSYPSGFFDPNTSLTFNGTQFLDGDPYVVGTITFDPDYQQSSNVAVPITFAFTFEGFTITRTQAAYYNGYDALISGATGVQIQLEDDLHTTGAVDPNSADIHLDFANNKFTGGFFNFGEITDAADQVFSGNMRGSIDSLTPVAVPEPSELALMMSGVVAAIAVSMRRRWPAPSRSR